MAARDYMSIPRVVTSDKDSLSVETNIDYQQLVDVIQNHSMILDHVIDNMVGDILEADKVDDNIQAFDYYKAEFNKANRPAKLKRQTAQLMLNQLNDYLSPDHPNSFKP